jgi:hypothetical protein
MKSLDELQSFYDTHLLGDLRALEGQRKGVVKKITTIGIVVVAILVIVLFFMGQAVAQNPMFLLFPLVIGGIIIVGAIKYLSRSYVSDFKQSVIKAIIHFLDDGLTYRAQSCIPESTYMSSEIFTRNPDRYKGDDFVEGRIGETKIAFSELHSEYKTESRDSKGRRRTHWHTIFKGLFFQGDFNKHFFGTTVVLPDKAEKLFGRFGQTLQKWNVGRDDLIKLEDPEFEKEFVVYGDDQVEARYILSTSLMSRIVDFKRKTGRSIHLSFVRSAVFVAISYTKDLFEPRLFKTLLDFTPIREYFTDLQVAIGIVEDLNLNTRIWTKE